MNCLAREEGLYQMRCRVSRLYIRAFVIVVLPMIIITGAGIGHTAYAQDNNKTEVRCINDATYIGVRLSCYRETIQVIRIDSQDPRVTVTQVLPKGYSTVNPNTRAECKSVIIPEDSRYFDGKPLGCQETPLENPADLNENAKYPRNRLDQLVEFVPDNRVVVGFTADFSGSTNPIVKFFNPDKDHGPQGLTVKDGFRLDGWRHGDCDWNTGEWSELTRCYGADIARPSLNVHKSLDVRKDGTVEISTKTREEVDNKTLYETRFYQAVGGCPMLVQEGKIVADGDYSQEDCENIDPHKGRGRTAVGVGENGKLIVVLIPDFVPNGKPDNRMTIQELAEYMKALGAVNAMNLDGGGSTQLWFRGNINDYLIPSSDLFIQADNLPLIENIPQIERVPAIEESAVIDGLLTIDELSGIDELSEISDIFGPRKLAQALVVLSEPRITTGNGEGYVKDKSGKPVASAEIIMEWSGGGQTLVTNSFGAYTFTDVPVGEMQITAYKDGYSLSVTVDIQGNQTNQVPAIVLPIETGPLQTTLPLSDAVVDVAGLNLRTGPGTDTNNRIIESYPNGTEVTVLGKNGNSDWLNVEMPDDKRGWMYAPYLQLNIDLADVNVIPSSPGQESTQPSDNEPEAITVERVEYPEVVAPGQVIRPKVTVRVNQGQLLESKGDMLRVIDDRLYKAWPHVAVVGTVNAGQSYTFEFYENDPIIAPDSEGTYENKWRIWRCGAVDCPNAWIGPEITIRFEVRQDNPLPPTPTSTPISVSQPATVGEVLFDADPRTNLNKDNNTFCSGFLSDCDFGNCSNNQRILGGPYCRGVDYPDIRPGLYRITLNGTGRVTAGATDYGLERQLFTFGKQEGNLPITYTFCWPGWREGMHGFETIVFSQSDGASISRITVEYLGEGCRGASVVVQPQPVDTSPTQISFTADRKEINAGECATLRWDVENVQAVYLEGDGVVGHGSKQVCPGSTETYRLNVTHRDGSTDEQTVRVTVHGALPPYCHGAGTYECTISATSTWHQTPLVLQAGNTFAISYVGGVWTVDRDAFPSVGPDGYTSDIDIQICCHSQCKLDRSQPYAKLLGRIGNGPSFVVGSGGTFTADRDGMLFLHINDQSSCQENDAGSVTMRLENR